MSNDLRYDQNEVRYLARRCNALMKEKDLIIARNVDVPLHQWPELDLETLQRLAVEMASIRARQCEQLKIVAVDTMIALFRKKGMKS